MGEGAHLACPAGGVPVEVEHHLNCGVFFQQLLDGLPGVCIGAVIGRVVVQGRVLDGDDAAFPQKRLHPAADGEHVEIVVQRPVGRSLGIGFAVAGVAFRGVGVQDQHRGLVTGQIPVQGLLHQRSDVRADGTGIVQLHHFRVRKGRKGRLGGLRCRRGRRFHEIHRKCLLRRRKPDVSSGF